MYINREKPIICYLLNELCLILKLTIFPEESSQILRDNLLGDERKQANDPTNGK